MFNTYTYNAATYNNIGLAIGAGSQDGIVFNGYSLQSTSVITTDLIVDNYPSREFDIDNIPRGDGRIYLNDYWRTKRITLKGYIKKDTNSLLEAEIDDFKYALSAPEANLDVKIDGVIRRFVASCTNADVFSGRQGYHITLVPFTLQFDCLKPFGTDTEYTVYDWLAQTGLTLNEQVENYGTAEATPVIIYNFSAASSVTGLTFTNNATSQSITITETISTGDYLRIDGENKEVTLNGSVVDYTGSFPRLDVGVNSFTSTITGTSATYSLTIKFYKPYL